MSASNNFSFRGVVNKAAELRKTPNGFEYVGISVGIPKYNKQEKRTEYLNVYVKIWGEKAREFTTDACKGAYWFAGEINAYQDTSGNGQGRNITEFVVQSCFKLEYQQRQQQNQGGFQQNQNQSMPAGQPARGPNNFQNRGQQQPQNNGGGNPQQQQQPQNQGGFQQNQAPPVNNNGGYPQYDQDLPF